MLRYSLHTSKHLPFSGSSSSSLDIKPKIDVPLSVAPFMSSDAAPKHKMRPYTRSKKYNIFTTQSHGRPSNPKKNICRASLSGLDVSLLMVLLKQLGFISHFNNRREVRRYLSQASSCCDEWCCYCCFGCPLNSRKPLLFQGSQDPPFIFKRGLAHLLWVVSEEEKTHLSVIHHASLPAVVAKRFKNMEVLNQSIIRIVTHNTIILLYKS